jgi:hypothetical protein
VAATDTAQRATLEITPDPTCFGACLDCGRRGVPYEHRGITFGGLCAYRGERLCPACRDARMAETGVTIRAEDRFRFLAYAVNSRDDRDSWFPGSPLNRAFDPDGRF